jgi:hypothetical protein
MRVSGESGIPFTTIFQAKHLVPMKRFFHSIPVAVLLIVLVGVTGAYKSISRRERANAKATEARMKQEVADSINGLKIDLPPLSQAAPITTDAE